MKLIFSCLGLLVIGMISPVFGHGLGDETFEPIFYDGRNMTASFSINPPIFEHVENEKRLKIDFFEVGNEQYIENITFHIEILKEDEKLLDDVFFDERGRLVLDIISGQRDIIDITGKYNSEINAWSEEGEQNIIVNGPIFESGGLYTVKIEILTIDSITNKLDGELVFEEAVSVAERTNHMVTSNGKSHNIGITSFYDQIRNFEYDSKKNIVKFSMPFNWETEYIEQVKIVHEEIHIPKTFGDWLVTKYEGQVNGIELPNDSLVADDYSEDDRIVHVIVTQKMLHEIKNQAMQVSDYELQFVVYPSDEVILPLSAHTTSVEYQVDLWWEPEIIKPDEKTKFFIDINERYIVDRNKESVHFDFILEQQGTEIFRDNVSALLNAESKSNVVEIEFLPTQTGPINLVIDRIDGKSLATVDFMVVVKELEINNIPSWIKNNASLWAKDSIDDQTFIGALEYLIKEDIISVPEQKTGSSENLEIPSWVKNNARYWSEDQIDDYTFLNAIEFMVQNGIIKIQ